MKKIILMALLLVSAGNALAAGKLVTLSRFSVGKTAWAFTREEVMLTCGANQALFVLNPSTLMQYPLNAAAQRQLEAGNTRWQPLSVILLDDPQHPGHKMSVEPFIQRAKALCTP